MQITGASKRWPWLAIISFFLLVANCFIQIRWQLLSNSLTAYETNEYLPVSQKLYQALFFRPELAEVAQDWNYKGIILPWLMVPFLALSEGAVLDALRMYSVSVFLLTIFFLWIFFRLFLDRSRSALATACFASIPWLYQSAHNFSGELPSIACFTAQCILMIKLVRRPSLAAAVLLGAITASGICLRPLEGLVSLLFLAVVAFSQKPASKGIWGYFAIAALFCVALSTAWFFDNFGRMVGWVQFGLGHSAENYRAGGDELAYLAGWAGHLIGLHGAASLLSFWFAQSWSGVLAILRRWETLATMGVVAAAALGGTFSSNPEYRYFVTFVTALFLPLVVFAVAGTRRFVPRTAILIGVTTLSLWVGLWRTTSGPPFGMVDYVLSGNVWLDRGDIREEDPAIVFWAEAVSREFQETKGSGPALLVDESAGRMPLVLNIQERRYRMDVRPVETIVGKLALADCAPAAAAILDAGTYFLWGSRPENEYAECERAMLAEVKRRGQTIKTYVEPDNGRELHLLGKRKPALLGAKSSSVASVSRRRKRRVRSLTPRRRQFRVLPSESGLFRPGHFGVNHLG